MTGWVYIRRVSAEPSLAEIQQEMCELLDKQVHAQKEKNFRGSHKLPQAHEKCAMKMKQRNTKKITRV